MPRRSEKVVTIDGDCHLDREDVLRVMRDLTLYTRFPMLATFKPKLVRMLARTQQLAKQRSRDAEIRKLYHDSTDEFLTLLWELQQAHRAPEGFAEFMLERHNKQAERFVMQARHGPVVLT